jgi:hypothetical protein
MRDDLSYLPYYVQKIRLTEYPRHQPAAVGLSFSLLGNFQCVINFDAKVSNCAFELGMP